MTKLKSKKMTKSTFAIIIMAIVMVAMLAFGGTYAYFTASATGIKDHQIKTGTVSLTTDVNGSVTEEDANRTFVTGPVVPGMNILETGKALSVKNLSTVETFIYVTVSVNIYNTTDFEDGELKDGVTPITADVLDLGKILGTDAGANAGKNEIDVNGWKVLTGDEADNIPAGVYYQKVSAIETAGQAEEIDFCTEIKFDADNHYKDGAYDSTNSDDVDVEGKIITVSFSAVSIQSYGLGTGAEGETELQVAVDGYKELTAA